jgi:hypothetical protein
MAITAKTARYIELDNRGFEVGGLELGEVRFDCSDIPDELAEEGDVRKIAQHLVRLGYDYEAAAYQAQSAKDFYGLGSDCLWITFARDHLWWTFANPHVLWRSDDVRLIERVRRSIGGWRNTDLNGAPLTSHGLSDRIKGFAARSLTGPDGATLCELLQLINGNAASVRRPEAPPAAGETFSFQVPSTLFTVGDIIKKPSAAPDEAGLYAWWFDELPDVPLAGSLAQNGFRLAYIGIASHRPGSHRTLRQRLRNHCKGPIATSTLRRSLAAILRDQLKLNPFEGPGKKIRLPKQEEAILSNWLAVHARVAWATDERPWIGEAQFLESGLLLPLNIRGNTHQYVQKLRVLRRQFLDCRHDRLAGAAKATAQ